MKKKNVVWIIAGILILVAIVSYFIYQNMVEEGKKYVVETIEQVNYIVVKQENLYGVMDKQGKVIVDMQFNQVIIPNPQKAVFICENAEGVKVYNDNQQEILTQYQDVSAIRLQNIASSFMYEKSVLIYEKDDKYGLINFDGTEITKPIYDSIEGLPYKEGELLVKQNGKTGVMNIKGNVLIDIQYESVAVDNYFVENEGYQNAGYIVSEKTQEGYRYGYIDLHGKLIVKPEYNDLSRITDIKDNETVYLTAARNGKYGVLKNGNPIIPNEYQSIRYDKPNHIFVVEKSKKFGAISAEGKELIPVQYSQIDITGMYIYAKNNDTTEVYDTEGNLTNRDSQIEILETQNENYQIEINNIEGTTYSIIDQQGNKLTKEKYSYIEYLYGENFIVSKGNGKLGIIDSRENIKLNTGYESIEKVQNTDFIKAVMPDKVTEVFTKDFKLIVSMNNAIVESQKSYIKLYNDTETIYFDMAGNEKSYKELEPNRSLYAKKLENGKWTFENMSGIQKEFAYDKVTELNEYGFAGIKKDGKWGIINQEGNIIQEPIYEFGISVEPDFIGDFYKVEYGFGEFYYTNAK